MTGRRRCREVAVANVITVKAVFVRAVAAIVVDATAVTGSSYVANDVAVNRDWPCILAMGYGPICY